MFCMCFHVVCMFFPPATLGVVKRDSCTLVLSKMLLGCYLCNRTGNFVFCSGLPCLTYISSFKKGFELWAKIGSNVSRALGPLMMTLCSCVAITIGPMHWMHWTQARSSSSVIYITWWKALLLLLLF